MKYKKKKKSRKWLLLLEVLINYSFVLYLKTSKAKDRGALEASTLLLNTSNCPVQCMTLGLSPTEVEQISVWCCLLEWKQWTNHFGPRVLLSFFSFAEVLRGYSLSFVLGVISLAATSDNHLILSVGDLVGLGDL